MDVIPLKLVSNDQIGVVLAAFLFFATISIFFSYTQLSKHGHGRGRVPCLPPGPLGVPLLGCLPFLDPNLHRYFAGLARSYGPVLSLRLGTELFVVISSPAAAREVFKDNDVVFANHVVPAAMRAFHGWHHDLLFAPYGPVWRALRKVCMQNFLSQANLEVLRPLREREVRRAVADLRGRAGEPVLVKELTLLATFNVMTSMLWGGSSAAKDGNADEDDAVTKELVEVVEAIAIVLWKSNISDFIPAVEALDLQGIGRRMKRIMARFVTLVDKLDEQRRRTTATSTTSSGTGESAVATIKKRALIHVLMEIVERGDPQTPLSMDNVRGVLLNMLAGSTHTTSNTIEWAMAELLHHPAAMARVHEELDAVVGRRRAVEESDVHKLPYLSAVVRETMRLHPVIPLLVPHTPSSSCVVGGYTIPKGASVFTNVWAIQRDPSIWEDPDEFKPERFLQAPAVDNSTVQGAPQDENDVFVGGGGGGNDFSFLPFGSGRRICIGAAMAETSLGYMLASLLHAFKWRVPAGVELDLTEKYGLVLTKATPLRAIPVVRLQDAELYHA